MGPAQRDLRPCAVPVLRVDFSLRGVQPVLEELGAESGTGDAQPGSGLGLIAVSQAIRLGIKLTFDGIGHEQLQVL